ncbi:MAG: YafY family protein [Clostridia bacterium]
MKTDRVFSCLMMLLSSNRVTAAQLALRLEVSERTVIRYMKSLEEGGVPIISYTGNKGGFEIAENYKINYAYFTIEEYEKLILCVTDSALPDYTKKMLIEKLCALSHIKKSEKTTEVIASTEHSEYLSDLINTISVAINTNKCLEINYENRNGEYTKRVIEPHCKLLRDGAWYCYAFCHTKNEFRTFKLMRIGQATMLSEKFIPKPYNLQTHFELKPINERGGYINLTFLVNKNSYLAVKDWSGNEKVTPCGNRYLVYTMQPDDKSLRKELLSFGKDIEIISPLSLKYELHKLIEELFHYYS